jgi:hypothetical protein
VVTFLSILAFLFMWAVIYGGSPRREEQDMQGWFVKVQRWEGEELVVEGLTPYASERVAVEKGQRVVDFYKGLGGEEVRPGVVQVGAVEHRITVVSGRSRVD